MKTLFFAAALVAVSPALAQGPSDRPSLRDQTSPNEEVETYSVLSEKTGQPVTVRVRRRYPPPEVYILPPPVILYGPSYRGRGW